MWPDNGVPSPLDPLVRFVRQVRHEMNRFPTMGPTIIHCSAGVGRTGTFVGIDKLLQDYKNKSYVDIFGMVYEMRMSRCLMVQTEVRFSREILKNHDGLKILGVKFEDQNLDAVYLSARIDISLTNWSILSW